MGQAAGASVASIAALGLSASGSISKSYGTQAADEFQAQRAERAAQYGRVQAQLTDAVMREHLNTTLSNIDTIRAAGHIDPTSPTTAAIADRQILLSDRQRTAAVLSQRAQVAEDVASADYLRKAGDYAVTMGWLGAGIDVLGGLGKGLTAPQG